MFVGRKNELAKLNEMYNTDKFQFAVIYGRRRIGKTALIQEFIKNKRAIYFVGLKKMRMIIWYVYQLPSLILKNMIMYQALALVHLKIVLRKLHN